MFNEVIVFLHEDFLEPPLEDVADFVMPTVTFLVVDTVEFTHAH